MPGVIGKMKSKARLTASWCPFYVKWQRNIHHTLYVQLRWYEYSIHRKTHNELDKMRKPCWYVWIWNLHDGSSGCSPPHNLWNSVSHNNICLSSCDINIQNSIIIYLWFSRPLTCPTGNLETRKSLLWYQYVHDILMSRGLFLSQYFSS